MSTFDTISPWKDRRRVALDGDGVVHGIHSATDTDKWENGTSVNWTTYESSGWNCMVQTPKFYYKQYKDSDGWHFSVSPVVQTGFTLHPVCVKTDGTVMPYWYISAFEGWKDGDDKLRSLPAKQPTTSLTRTQCEAYSEANGTGYKNMDFNVLWAEQLLWVVEMAELNSQSIYRGIVDLEPGTDNHSQNTGHTVSLGNASGEVEVVADNPYTGDESTMVKPFSFRGHENFYGNVWKWISGWDKPDNGTNTIMGTDYTVEADYTSGYGTDFETTTPGFVPCKLTGGSESTFLCDYMHRAAATNRAALFSGGWYYGGRAGVFYLSLGAPASHAGRDVGGRAAFL